MQHLQPNTTLQGGKYRIERVLGQGGFGITYLARNTVFDVDVAIKEFFMKDENGRDGTNVTMPNTTRSELFQGQKEKFKKEAKRMFAIKNEHIIAVYDLFEENGTAYYVMDYVDGENLSDRLKRMGQPMTEAEVNKILPQILDALQTVHNAGIWHLDLKPANILVDKADNVKLIDFGASKQMNTQKGGATTSTAISYTNGFAPREQMEQNYDKFGPWTDLYALGATLYNLLTNKRPPLPTDIDDDMSEDKHLVLPMPNVSDHMKNLVLRLMNTNRMQRPQTILAVKDINLEECLKDVAPKVVLESAKKVSETEETKVVDKEIVLLSDENEEKEQLEWEKPDVNFFVAIKYALKDKFSYDMSRSGKAEFWWYALFYFISAVLLSLIPYRIVDLINIYLFTALVFVFVRRLHDSSLSGYWWFLLIPLALSIWGGTIAVFEDPDVFMDVLVLIVLTIIPIIYIGIRDSDKNENEYGDPVN